MCFICSDWRKGRITIEEAFQFLSENEENLESDHVDKVSEMLNEAWESRSYTGSVEKEFSEDYSYSDLEEDDDELVDSWNDYFEDEES
jgi:hypothetical protein